MDKLNKKEERKPSLIEKLFAYVNGRYCHLGKICGIYWYNAKKYDDGKNLDFDWRYHKPYVKCLTIQGHGHIFEELQIGLDKKHSRQDKRYFRLDFCTPKWVRCFTIGEPNDEYEKKHGLFHYKKWENDHVCCGG